MVSELSIKTKTAAYLLLKKEIEQKKAQQEQLKKELEPYLLEAETNSRGSHVLAFDTPLEVNGQRYASLQKMRKVVRVLDEDKVMSWLQDKVDSELEEEVSWDDIVSNSNIIVTVKHIDQDVLWDMFVQDLISQEELDSFFTETVTWAFSPIKE